MTKEPGITYNGDKKVYSIDAAGKLDNHMQNNKTGPLDYTTHKNLIQNR